MSNSATPQSTVPQADAPAPAAQATFAPARDLSAASLTGFLKRAGTMPRLLLLGCGGLMCLCFFTPEYFASLSIKDMQMPEEMRKAYYHSWLLFGWSTWWGILSFLFAFFTTIAVAADLVLGNVKMLRMGLRLLYPAVFALLSLTTGLGVLLGLMGIGLGTSRHYGDMGPTASDYSLFRVPIMAVTLLLVTLVALAISGVMLWKEFKAKDAATQQAVMPIAPIAPIAPLEPPISPVI